MSLKHPILWVRRSMHSAIYTTTKVAPEAVRENVPGPGNTIDAPERQDAMTNPEGKFGNVVPGRFLIVQPDEPYGFSNLESRRNARFR